MPDLSATHIPKPKNWQDFEQKCKVLFACELGDPNTQLNGRGGQSQNGVDIFGKRLNDGGQWVGIQCKLKESGYRDALTETELRAEVEKARKFKPAIYEFIVATTAPVDQSIQQTARLISEELAREGVHLDVHVYGWEELEARISQHRDATKAFHPDATPFTDGILEDLGTLRTGQDAIKDRMDSIDTPRIHDDSKAILLEIKAIRKEQSGGVSARDKEIDRYAKLIEEGDPGTALKLLDNLWTSLGETDTARTRYRIKANIGFAHLRLGEDALAADCLIEAYDLDPTARTAKTNLAAGYLLEGAFEKCVSTAEDVLAQDPSDENAASYLIQARQRFAPVKDPMSHVPEEIRTNPTVRAAVVFGLRLIDDPHWVEAALEWHEAHPDNRWLGRTAAEAVIEKASRSQGFAVGATGELDAEALSEAVDRLEKEWNAVVRSGARNIDPSLPNNLAQGLRLLSRHEEAFDVVKVAIERGADRSYLNRLAVVLTARKKSVAEALSYLSEDDPSDHDDAILKAEILQGENPKAALRLLENHDFSDAPLDQQHMARALSIECLGLLRAEARVIEQQLKHLGNDFPEHGNPLWLRARLIRLQKPVEQFEAAAELAREVTDETGFMDRFHICELLDEVGHFDDAVDLLKARVSLDRPSPALWLYLRTLANSHQKKLAQDVVASLSDGIRESPRCLDIRAVIAHKAGDLKEAIRCCEEYLKIRPNALYMRLRWAKFSLNDGKDAPVQEWIKQDVESLDGRPEDQAELALLLDHQGEFDRALGLAYKLARIHPRITAAQRIFSALMLLRPSASAEEDELLGITEIGPDTAFRVKNGVGETLSFRIECNPDLRLEPGDKSPEDDFANAVHTLKVGDSFSFPGMEDRGKASTWTVDEIKHKYVALLHDVLSHGEERHGHDFGFQKFHVDIEGPAPFEPMLRIFRQRYEQTQRILGHYQAKSLPCRSTARALGGDVFDIYDTLCGSGRHFHCCIGTAAERMAATGFIRDNSKKGCIADPITLEIIRRLDLKESVEAVCGAILITQSCLNEFLNHRERLTAGGVREQKSIQFNGENYILYENSVEEVQREVDRWSEVVEWVKKFPVVPAIGREDPTGSVRRILSEFDPELLDDVLAAEGKGFLLISEDFGYRQIASYERAVKTAWLQPILMLAVRQGVLSPERYSEIVANLCEAGHNFTSMSANDLGYAADIDPKGFNAMVVALFAPQVEVVSQMSVSTGFLENIWTQRPRDLATGAQTGTLLTGLLRLWGEEWVPPLKYFSNVRQLPRPFKEYLRDWIRGHFLVPGKTN